MSDLNPLVAQFFKEIELLSKKMSFEIPEQNELWDTFVTEIQNEALNYEGEYFTSGEFIDNYIELITTFLEKNGLPDAVSDVQNLASTYRNAVQSSNTLESQRNFIFSKKLDAIEFNTDFTQINRSLWDQGRKAWDTQMSVYGSLFTNYFSSNDYPYRDMEEFVSNFEASENIEDLRTEIFYTTQNYITAVNTADNMFLTEKNKNKALNQYIKNRVDDLDIALQQDTRVVETEEGNPYLEGISYVERGFLDALIDAYDPTLFKLSGKDTRAENIYADMVHGIKVAALKHRNLFNSDEIVTLINGMKETFKGAEHVITKLYDEYKSQYDFREILKNYDYQSADFDEQETEFLTKLEKFFVENGRFISTEATEKLKDILNILNKSDNNGNQLSGEEMRQAWQEMVEEISNFPAMKNTVENELKPLKPFE